MPSGVAPSRKVTTPPVGTPAADVTEAVNVTVCPNPDGFRLDATPVAVAAGLTTWPAGAELLPVKLASTTEYTAVTACAPPPRAAVVRLALPLERAAVPIAVAPS